MYNLYHGYLSWIRLSWLPPPPHLPFLFRQAQQQQQQRRTICVDAAVSQTKIICQVFVPSCRRPRPLFANARLLVGHSCAALADSSALDSDLNKHAESFPLAAKTSFFMKSSHRIAKLRYVYTQYKHTHTHLHAHVFIGVPCVCVCVGEIK